MSVPTFLGVTEIMAIFRSLVIDETTDLENDFSRYMGIRYSIATNSGRSAIYAAVKVAAGPGTEVIVPAFTCDVVPQAVIDAGAVPVFIDVNPATLDIRMEDLEKKISEKTRAVIIIHYFGKPAGNIQEILNLTKKHNIILVEDCAHALGAGFGGKKVGVFGDIGVFSLTKSLLNTDGGIFCTSRPDLYIPAKDLLKRDDRTRIQRFNDRIRAFVHGYKSTVDKIIFDRINTGKLKRTFFTMINYLSDGVLRIFSLLDRSPVTPAGSQYHHISRTGASIGRVQLSRIESLKESRNRIFSKLKAQSGYCYLSGKDDPGIQNAWMIFPLVVPEHTLDAAVGFFKNYGIELSPTWPLFQKELDGQKTPSTHMIRNRMLLWRIHPQITDNEMAIFTEVCTQFTAYLKSADTTLNRGA